MSIVGIGQGIPFRRNPFAALFPGPTFALDFARDPYATLHPAFSHVRATPSTLIQQYDGSFVQMLAGEFGLDGGRRVENLLNNTDTLATQGVTVEAADYWLSFTGTGSVAVSGVATDSLAGTGASDRVSKKITAGSAGTMTLTVTGSVTNAMLTKSRPGQLIADPEYVSNGVEILGGEIIPTGEGDGTSFAAWVDASTLPSTAGVSGGKFVGTHSGATVRMRYQMATQPGKQYRLVFECGADTPAMTVGTTAGGAEISSPVVAEGTNSIAFTAATAETWLSFYDGSTGFVLDNFSCRPIVHHGWGVDGVRWFNTDEYGTDLTAETPLGPELVANPGGPFYDLTGFSGVQTISSVVDGAIEIIAVDGDTDRLEYNLAGLSIGSRLQIQIDAASDDGSAYLTSFVGVNWAIRQVSSTRTVYTQDVTVSATPVKLRFYAALAGNAGDKLRVYSISVREFYPARAAGVVRNPAVTNLWPYANPTVAQLVGGGGCTDEAGFAGLPRSIGFPDNTATRYAYRALNLTGDHVVQVVMKMDDGGTPNTSTDFRMIFQGALLGTALNVDDLGDGLFRVWATSTATGVNQNYGIIKYTGHSARGFKVLLFQVHAGTESLPFVLTDGLSVTVDGDAFPHDIAEIGGTAGTWIVEHTPTQSPAVESGNQTLLDLYADANNRARVYNPSGDVGVQVTDGGVSQWSASDAGANWTAGTLQRLAVRFETDDGSLVTDGDEHLLDASMSVPDATVAYIGGDASSEYSGSIARIAYYGGA